MDLDMLKTSKYFLCMNKNKLFLNKHFFIKGLVYKVPQAKYIHCIVKQWLAWSLN